MVMMLPPMTERKKMLPPLPLPSMGRRGVFPPSLPTPPVAVGVLPRPAADARLFFAVAYSAYRSAQPARELYAIQLYA